MNYRIIKTVFKKEVVDSFRDKRTMIIMLVLPVILMPAIIIGIPALSFQREAEIQELPSNIAVVNYDATAGIPNGTNSGRVSPLFHLLNTSEENLDNYTNQLIERNLTDEEIEEFTERYEWFNYIYVEDENKAMQLFNENQVHAIVIIPEDILELEFEQKVVNISLKFDITNTRSRLAWQRVDLIVDEYYVGTIQSEVLGKMGLSEEEIEYIVVPSLVYPEDISTPEERGGFYLAMLLPMILGIYIVTGSMYHTIDITAGEKERHTLEALLVTPPSKTELVMGKFLSILLITMLIIIVAMVSLVVSLWYSSGLFSGMGAVSFSISAPIMIFIISIFFVLAVLVNSIEMAIAFFAKSFKEAENYVTPIIFMVLLPAIFLQSLAPEDMSITLFFLPIVNVLAVFQEVLLNVVDPVHITITILTSTIYAVLASILAIRLFNREEVLFRT